jgi:hypothetical protein
LDTDGCLGQLFFEKHVDAEHLVDHHDNRAWSCAVRYAKQAVQLRV